jgi:hypothetical protein
MNGNNDEDLFDGLTPVNSWDEVPKFAREAEEQAFWETHCFGPGLFKGARRPGGARAAVREHRAKHIRHEAAG